MGSAFRDSAKFRWKYLVGEMSGVVDVAQLVESLLSMREALGLVSSPAVLSGGST